MSLRKLQEFWNIVKNNEASNQEYCAFKENQQENQISS
jgi:hypothetical protein